MPGGAKDRHDALKIAFAGMIGMALAMGIGRFVFTPILPGMMNALGMSATTAGVVAAANYVGYLVGALLASGGWAAGWERKLGLGSLFASAVLAAAMGATESTAAFVLIRFAAGVASAFAMIFLLTLILARLSELRQESLGTLNFAGVGLGISISAIMVAVLLAAGSPWQAGWFWSGAISLAGAIVVVLLAAQTGRQVGPAMREPPLPRSRAFTGIVVAYGLFGFGYIVTATFLIAIVRGGDAGPQFEAMVWLATGLAGIPSVWLWARLSRGLGVTGTFALGCVVEAVGVTASVALGGYAGPLIGGVLLGGTFIAITYLGLQAGRRLAGAAPRRALALMTASFGVGQILGPIFAGAAADWSGSFTFPSICAAIVLLVAAVIGWRAGLSSSRG